MGLEFHWMGLLLKDDKSLLQKWCLGISHTKKDNKKLEELENTTKLINKLGDRKTIKINDRQEIYQALSDTSHVKFKNICFLGDFNKQYGHILGGFQTQYDIGQCVKAVDLSMRFILTEISEYYKISDFSTYKRDELHMISGSMMVGIHGSIEPKITSKGAIGSDIENALAMLEMVADPREFVGEHH